jgi:hypothetical protein
MKNKKPEKNNYNNLGLILEKLNEELGGEIYLSDIQKYLGSGPYQRVQRLKKGQDRYPWIKKGRKISKLEKIPRKRYNKESKTIEDYDSLKEEYFNLYDKYSADLSRTDLNQGKKELRSFYEKIRTYEKNKLNNKNIDFLQGRWKR